VVDKDGEDVLVRVRVDVKRRDGQLAAINRLQAEGEARRGRQDCVSLAQVLGLRFGSADDRAGGRDLGHFRALHLHIASRRRGWPVFVDPYRANRLKPVRSKPACFKPAP